MENRNEATGLLHNVSGGTSDKVHGQRSFPSCVGIGDGDSLRVHNEEEGANKEGRSARARACEASSIAAWSLGLTRLTLESASSGGGCDKLLSEGTPSLATMCMG